MPNPLISLLVRKGRASAEGDQPNSCKVGELA